MAELTGLTIPILRFVQIWNGAVNSAGPLTRSEHAELIRDYSMSVKVLEYCIGIIQSQDEKSISELLEDAVHRCMDHATQLAYRHEKLAGKGTKKRIAFLLAPWDRLQAEYKKFTESVQFVHDLTQDLVLRSIQSRQADSQAMMTLVLEKLERDSSNLPSYARGEAASAFSGVTSFTTGRNSVADVVTLAEEVVARSVAQGVRLDTNPSLALGTVVLTQGPSPKYVPVVAKYDTGADANFIPESFIQDNGLSSSMEQLPVDDPEGNVFIGLNNEEYHIEHTITLQWCAQSMHHIRTTKFHVAVDLPYNIVLGDPFIRENMVFHPQRTALPLRRKRPDAARRAEEEENRRVGEANALLESQRTRREDALQRVLTRQARKTAKAQTSASSMMTPASSDPGLSTGTSLSNVTSTTSATVSQQSLSNYGPAVAPEPGSPRGVTQVNPGA